MIIDLILDRKDGVQYNPKALYDYATNALEVDNYTEIATALDSGENQDVQRELCAYIINHEYNPDICEYVNSVDWL